MKKTLYTIAVAVGSAFAAQPTSPLVARSVFHNLHQLASGAEQFYLEHQKSAVTFAELVGPGKIIGRLPSIAGEDYSTVVLRQGMPVVLTMPSGEKIAADPLRSDGCTYAFHKVRRDDKADSIAASVGISLDRLRELNPGVDLSQLQPSDAVRVK